MKKLFLFVVAIAFAFVQVFVFAQYGGGGWSYSPSTAWVSNLALNRDNCPNWDYSASFYDGTCGFLASNPSANDVNDLLETGPEDEDGGRVLNVPAWSNNWNNWGSNWWTNNSNQSSTASDSTVIPGSLPDTGVDY